MVDAGANGLNYAQRGKPVTKRPRFLQKEAKWTLGSGQGCNCRPILKAIASLIEVQRPDLAIVLIEQELYYQTRTTQSGLHR